MTSTNLGHLEHTAFEWDVVADGELISKHTLVSLLREFRCELAFLREKVVLLSRQIDQIMREQLAFYVMTPSSLHGFLWRSSGLSLGHYVHHRARRNRNWGAFRLWRVVNFLALGLVLFTLRIGVCKKRWRTLRRVYSRSVTWAHLSLVANLTDLIDRGGFAYSGARVLIVCRLGRAEGLSDGKVVSTLLLDDLKQVFFQRGTIYDNSPHVDAGRLGLLLRSDRLVAGFTACPIIGVTWSLLLRLDMLLRRGAR